MQFVWAITQIQQNEVIQGRDEIELSLDYDHSMCLIPCLHTASTVTSFTLKNVGCGRRTMQRGIGAHYELESSYSRFKIRARSTRLSSHLHGRMRA